MFDNNNIRKRKKGKHLTSVERGKIEAYLKEGISKVKIAKKIGVSERTIYREIKRGTIELKDSEWRCYKVYDAEYAQRKYEENQSNKEGNLKIGNNHKLAEYLEDLILKQKYSPYAALELARRLYSVDFCLKTLYNYIHKNIFLNLCPKNLPHKGKRKRKTSSTKRIRKTGGKSIEERSDKINTRKELGHWEIDTVLGSREKGPCLLVMTERLSRLQKIIKIKNKTSKEVVGAMKNLKKKYSKVFSKKFKTLTSDNGSEFMNSKSIEDLGISDHFYCHSFCSYERGSNENANRLIRRWIPKGKSISKVSKEKIKEIEDWMNNYPRNLFKGRNANEIYREHLNY